MKKIRFLLAISILSAGIFSTLNCSYIDSALKNRRGKSVNDQISESNEKINQALQEGGKAYSEKNYDLAIKKFEEGFNAAPTFPGSAPVFLNNKALALIGRGTEAYNKSVKADATAKATAKESAKKDFEEAVLASENALEILKNAVTDFVNVQKSFEANTLLAFTNRKNAYRLLAQTGAERTKGKTALNVFREYMAVETDPAKKAKAQLELALTLQDSDEFELAVVEFQKILETDANNVDALAGIGLNLVNVGYANQDLEKGKEQLKEAAKYLQQYVVLAPETHKFKQEAEGIIESLKDSANPSKAIVKKENFKGKNNRYSVSEAKIAEPNSAGLMEPKEK